MKKQLISIIVVLAFSIIALTACSITEEEENKKIEDVDFTIVEKEEIPEIVAQKVAEEKKEPFKFSTSEGDYLYIAIGYGEQPTGGYSIQVEELYRAKDCIVVETKLVGPSEEDAVVTILTYPYIVIKIENVELPICYK